MRVTRIEIKEFKDFAKKVDAINEKIFALELSLNTLKNYINGAEVRLVDDFSDDETSDDK